MNYGLKFILFIFEKIYFMEWYVKCIKNYFNFSGRARRREYWIFLLFNILIVIGLSFFESFISELLNIQLPFPLVGLYILFAIIPHFAVVVRRLHDINKSGGYWFVRFIPLIGPIWLLVLLCEDSWDGPNKWGINPKNIGNDDVIDQIGKALDE